jgi:hypothetical protein
MVKGFYTEMPHILVPGTERSFDLELEDKTADDVIQLIKDIAEGNPISDKWERTVELDDEKNRKEFIRVIGNNFIFKSMLNKFTENERSLIQAILALVG